MGKIAEVRIRNVDAAALAKIDVLASKKDMSRNAYLKAYIESLSVLDEVKEIENKYVGLVNAVSEVVESNTAELEKIRLILEKSKGEF